jgi:hypothetical protein
MTPEQRHPYSRIAVENAPEVGGILYLFVLDRLEWVQWDANLRARLLDLYPRYPEATDFMYSACSAAEGTPIAEKLQHAYQLADRSRAREPLAARAVAAGR